MISENIISDEGNYYNRLSQIFGVADNYKRRLKNGYDENQRMWFL